MVPMPMPEASKLLQVFSNADLRINTLAAYREGLEFICNRKLAIFRFKTLEECGGPRIARGSETQSVVLLLV